MISGVLVGVLGENMLQESNATRAASSATKRSALLFFNFPRYY